MGNEQTKNKKTKFNQKHMDPNKLNIILKQIYFTAQLYKDRRKGQQSVREKELFALFREPANKRSKDNEFQKASAIVNDLKWIKAFDYIMRYADVLKDNETIIQMSKGNVSKINELIPYVESVIWGCQKCNIECVKALKDFVCQVFGVEVQTQLCNFTQVTPELKECFASVLPSEKEVKTYLIDLCNKSGIALQTMDEIGHGLSSDFPDPKSKPNPPTQPTDPTSYGGQPYPGYPNYPTYPTCPSYPSSGYPENSAPGNQTQDNTNQGIRFTFGQPQNGLHQEAYDPNKCQQGIGYPHNGGFPQGDFPQGGFPQVSHPQNNCPQEGFPQHGYPQGGFLGNSRQGFTQDCQPISTTCAQGVNGYPQFGDYPPSNFNNNHFEKYKQAPNTGLHAPSNPTFSDPSSDSRQNAESSNPGVGEAYPGFQKFENDMPAARMSSGDPLDELDMRLRDIKNGLKNSSL